MNDDNFARSFADALASPNGRGFAFDDPEHGAVVRALHRDRVPMFAPSDAVRAMRDLDRALSGGFDAIGYDTPPTQGDDHVGIYSNRGRGRMARDDDPKSLEEYHDGKSRERAALLLQLLHDELGGNLSSKGSELLHELAKLAGANGAGASDAEFKKSSSYAEAFDVWMKSRGAKDQPPPFSGRPEPGGTMTMTPAQDRAMAASSRGFSHRWPSIAKIPVG